MKHMTIKEFAEYLLQHEWNGEPIEFAFQNDSTEDVEDYSDYWFCARFYLPEYASDMLIFDSCGGGYPYAIPLDDEDAVEELLRFYFTHHEHYDANQGLFVETKEED